MWRVDASPIARSEDGRIWHKAENFGSAATSAAIRGTREVPDQLVPCPPLTRSGQKHLHPIFPVLSGDADIAASLQPCARHHRKGRSRLDETPVFHLRRVARQACGAVAPRPYCKPRRSPSRRRAAARNVRRGQIAVIGLGWLSAQQGRGRVATQNSPHAPFLLHS